MVIPVEVVVVLVAVLCFIIGVVTGTSIERAWFRRNLVGPQPPGIRRRLD